MSKFHTLRITNSWLTSRVSLATLSPVTLVMATLSMGVIVGPVLAQAQPDAVVKITREDCSRLIRHQPSDDVAYTPGVTKRGKKVVSADLNSQPITLPDVIRIPITVDLFERYNIPANQANFEAEAEIGVVEVHKDGSSYFNGQPLQDEEQRELAQKCQNIIKNGR